MLGGLNPQISLCGVTWPLECTCQMPCKSVERF